MLIPILILLATLLVLVVMYVVDDAVRVLNARAGLPASGGMRWSKRIVWLILLVVFAQFFIPSTWLEPPPPQVATYGADSLWTGADTTRLVYLPKEQRDLVRYGRELIANTAHYLGPNGVVMRNTNALNCQNCHLDAGTKPWGNNYGAVWSTYPKFRARSGSTETVAKRINDCVERSLNGTALDTTEREMRAMLAYMEWLGSGIEKGTKPKGSGIVELAFMDRAADPVHGAEIYTAKCESCHGADGLGQLKADGRTHQFPPLWGDGSYNDGAGLFRMSRFAGYVKTNMPQGVTWEYPQLTDEEAWDVAAYVNSQRRPSKDITGDWPDIAAKPVDHPFGPFADTLPETQHKYGPFGPIAAFKKKQTTAAP
ncbi:MAG: c-type cytochrome [Flavobacteriales bacterium]|nr:c-type cytochrome [Flavobacteriales bacterium]